MERLRKGPLIPNNAKPPRDLGNMPDSSRRCQAKELRPWRHGQTLLKHSKTWPEILSPFQKLSPTAQHVKKFSPPLSNSSAGASALQIFAVFIRSVWGRYSRVIMRAFFFFFPPEARF